MALGEGAFVVPAILSDSDVITLQVYIAQIKMLSTAYYALEVPIARLSI